MNRITSFEEIEAWEVARELTRQIYALTKRQPFARDFGLRDQIRRAAISIMSNIAEGYESQTEAMFTRYLGIAKGSAGELRVRSRISSQSSCSDLHQIWSRTIERNRRRSQVYVEDFAIEERPKMVVKMSARM